MGTGKYSPLCPYAHESGYERYVYNCYGEVAPEFDKEKYEYNEKLHYAQYDSEGFDSYGYSSFNLDGVYVGMGTGIDRYGYTENDYLLDSIAGGDLYYGGGLTELTAFVRERR